MISYNMPFFDHSFHQFRFIFDKVSDYEKCGRSAVLFQGVENRGSISILVTGVKSQIEYFFVCIFSIVSIILF